MSYLRQALELGILISCREAAIRVVANYYKLLGLEPTATDEEIKRAYRSLARKYHPDSGGKEKSDVMFQKITEAYTTLSDPQRKKRYDDALGFGLDAARRFQAYKKQSQIFEDNKVEAKDTIHSARERLQGAAEGPAAVRLKNVGEESRLEEIFGKVTKSLGREGLWSRVTKSFSRPANGNSSRSADAARDEPAEARREFHFVIDALESIRGTTREAALEENHAPRMLRIKIPPGICDNSILKVNCPAKGASGPVTIYARVSIRAHEFVEREQQDMVVHVPLTLGEAIKGAELEVPTAEGPVPVKLPPNWDLAKRLRIKGKGPRYAATNSVGDVYIRFFVVPPDRPSSQLDLALCTVEGHYSQNPRGHLPSFTPDSN